EGAAGNESRHDKALSTGCACSSAHSLAGWRPPARRGCRGKRSLIAGQAPRRPSPAFTRRIAAVGSAARLRGVQFGAGGGAGLTLVVLRLAAGGQHLAVRQDYEGVEFARDGHAAGGG